MSKIGIIDIGSNTFNLLVSCTKTKQGIYSQEKHVGIRKGTKKKIIQKTTIEKSIVVIQEFKKICKNLNCETIHVIATASLRNALNRHEFIENCKQETNLIVNVISGDTEAKLIFDGILNNIKNLYNFVIVDIGGASTEFIITKNRKSVFRKSFSFGSQLLIQKFNPSNPINKEEIKKIRTFLKQKLKHLIPFLKIHKVKNLIGTSGSFNCITKIQLDKNYNTKYQRLDVDHYKKIISPKILNSTINEREKIPGLLKMRAENIIITIILINFLIDEGIQNIYTTKFSLKDGVFSNILNKIITWQESLL